MATVAIVAEKFASSSPMLVREYDLTGGTTQLAITHGETTAPDMIVFKPRIASATIAAWSAAETSATQVTVYCSVDNANQLCKMYLIWFNHNSGGLNNVS